MNQNAENIAKICLFNTFVKKTPNDIHDCSIRHSKVTYS